VDRPAFVGPPHLVVVSVPNRGLSMEAFVIVSFSRLLKEESLDVRTILKGLRLPDVERAVRLPALEDRILERSV